MKVTAFHKLAFPIIGVLAAINSSSNRVFVRADQEAADDNNNNDNANADADDNANDNNGDANDNANADNNANGYADDGEVQESSNANDMAVCADSAIQVEAVSILCDSPGTYYYGSSKYRNSDSCMPGDKAKVLVDFLVQDADEIYAAGGEIYVTLLAESFSTPGDQLVYEHASLCDLSTVSSLDKSECGGEGEFRISTQFMWSESENSNYNDDSFYPLLTVGFKSAIKNNAFDLGGANTDLCKGNYFSNWKEGVKKTYSGALSKFMATFGILVGTAILLGALAWHLVARSCSNDGGSDDASGGAMHESKKVKGMTTEKSTSGSSASNNNGSSSQPIVWNDEEFKKIKLLAQQDVLDF